jgi:hypothetical protein
MSNSKQNQMPLLSSIAPVLAPVLATISMVALSGCAGGRNVTVKIADTPLASKALDFLIPSAYAAASNIELCIKRLRFKAEDNDDELSSELDLDDDNVDFSPGLVTVTPGAEIGQFELPAGIYERIEIDVEEDCDDSSGAPSVAWTNGGSFSSTDTITIKFEGTFDASESGGELSLGFAAIVAAMDAVPGGYGGNDIKNALEAAGGEIED